MPNNKILDEVNSMEFEDQVDLIIQLIQQLFENMLSEMDGGYDDDEEKEQ